VSSKKKMMMIMRRRRRRRRRLRIMNYKTKKLRGLSPRANYTDRAAAAGRRS